MTTIKNEGLFGEAVPTVFIDSITLEDTTATPAEVINPHINHVREVSFIDIEPPRLKTTLNITMKESDNHIFSSLIGKDELHEYLKIGIIQSKRADVLSFEQVEELIISNPSAGEWSSTASEGLDIRTVALTNPDFNIDRDVYETLSDGRRVFNINFSQSFTVPSPEGSNPENLSYYVMCYMDMEGFLRSYGIMNPSSSMRANGKVASEIVFKDSELTPTSYVFRNGSGEIWPGMVMRSADGKYTSLATVLSSPEELFLTEVPNTTLQDFRILRLPKEMDISLLSEDLTEMSAKNVFSNQKNITIGSEKALSDIKTSRKSDGTINFLFEIDVKKLLQSKSPFASVISNSPESLNEIIEMSQVTLLQLMRVRSIEKDSSNSASGITKVPEIANTQDSKPSIVAKIIAGNASASDNIRKVNTSLTASGKVIYTGTDIESANITDGKHSYYVEIEMLDGIKAYLKNLLLELTSNKEILYAYLNEINKPSLSEYLTVRNDPHVYDISEEIRAASKKKESNINKFTGKISKSAKEEMYRRYPPGSPQPWVNPLAIFTEAYSAVFGTSPSIESRISGMISPDTGNLNGLTMFVKLYDALIEKLSSIVSDTMGSPTTKSQKNFQSSTPTAIKVRKHFQYILDARIPDNVGYQYISTEVTTNGLSTMSLRDWDQRVTAETNKWLSEDSTSIRIPSFSSRAGINQQISRNDYSFLSPQHVRLSGNVYDTRTLELGEEQYFKIYESIHSFNSNNVLPKKPVTNSSLLDSFYLEGATLYDPASVSYERTETRVSSKSTSIGTGSKKKTTIFDASIDALPVKKNAPLPGHKSQMPAGSQMFLSSYFLNSKDSSDINFYNTTSDENKLKMLSHNEVTSLPNQILTIAASSATPEVSNYNFFSPSKTSVDMSQSPIFQLNVNSLRRVEYFTEDSEWSLLTRETISGLSSGQIVCRLTPYHNTKLSVGLNRNLVLPIYDELFLIDIGNFTSPTEAPVVPIRRRILSKLKDSLELSPPTEFITTNFGLGYL